MRVAIYARVSTDAQEARGTIGSQLALLRERVVREGHELVAEYTDDGLSGARLDRPGLDALRDAAEAGYFEGVWCLSADRLARMYAYQVIVLDELSRHGVTVRFHDTPQIEDDPQARLLTQVQGVIAEYERAKIGERYRRGKLWRSRAGEVIAWKVPYGYRRLPRAGERPAHLEVFEREAAVVRRIFDDYVRKDISMRQIAMGLNRDGIRSPTGRAVWSVSTIGRILRNEAYIGRVYYNRTETVPQRRHAGKTRQVQRPRDQWIAIAVPAILDETLFEAAQRVSRDNSRWNLRRAEPGHWLLRGLVKCGHCGVGVSCHKMRGRNGTFHRYYYCHNHDPLRAGGEHRRCPERNIRADELDTFVFEQVRETLLRPEVLLAGEHALSARREPVADELLQAQLAKLQRKSDAANAEKRRLVDLYQAALIDRDELLRRSKEVQDRKQNVEQQRDALIAQRKELAQQNALRERIIGFSVTVGASIDHVDFDQRQKLLRLVVEQVLVQGWRVEIKLRIPLDEAPTPPDPTPSSKDRLRSVGREDCGVVDEAIDGGHRSGLVGEHLVPFSEGLVRRDQKRAPFVARRDELEEDAGLGLILLHVGEVVEDQKMVAVEPCELAFEGELAPCHLQALHQIGGAGEEHAIAVLDQGEADGGGKMAFAGAGWAEHEAVGALVEPAVTGGERHDLGLCEHRHGLEVEGGEALSGEQPGLPEMAFDAPSVAFGELVLGEGCEEAGGGPTLGIGALGEALPELVDRRQAEIGEHQGELDGIDLVGIGCRAVVAAGHDAPPTLSRDP